MEPFDSPLRSAGAGAARKRIAHAGSWALLAAVLTGIWAFVPSTQAHAYVDPSVMTYTIQALAGVAVALSALAGVLFRRTRRKLFELLNIDENANKLVESDPERIDPSSPNATEKLEAARSEAEEFTRKQNAAADKHSARDLRWRTRFIFALVICLFCAFIAFIAPAIEIIGSNADSLVFGIQSIWWIPTLFCSLFAVAIAAAISALKGKPYYIAVLLVFLIGLAAYVQSMFMNQGMMPADGGFIGWTDWYFVSKMIFSGIVWALIIAVPLIAFRNYQHTALKAACGLACALVIMQGVGVASVALEAGGSSEQDKPYVTQGGLLTVAPKNNVVEFVLDTYDTSIMEQLLQENPNYLADFEDFTYFHNSTGTMVPTHNAVPNMLTQNKPKPGQDMGDYRRTKYEDATFLNDIYGTGASIGLYTDSLMADYNIPADRQMASQTMNVHPVSNAPVDVWRTFGVSVQCALYREAPWVLKPTFWYYTSDLNNRMIADSTNGNLNDTLYELDDAAITKMIKSQGLEVDESQTGAYRFIHLFGPHFPFSVDENGEFVGTNKTDQITQAKGSMRVVIEYMNCLKELGLYDSTTIIVTADHGIWNISDDPVKEPVSPLIMVKPAMDEGHDRAAAVISDTPICHDDLQPTIIAALGLDHSAYGTTVFEVDDPARVRYYDATTNSGDEGERFVEYAISGNALDINGWEKTGEVWYGA